MAKRKRLTPANLSFLDDGAAAPAPVPGAARRAPIADVAAEASAVAAMETLSSELADARENGRLVQRLRLDQIDLGYLARDRIAAADEEMEALAASIRDRGQQSPIDVVATADGRYGLISGWRRCEAIRRLQAAGTGDGTVLALLRKPEGAADAYLSMIEENEIRVGLSYFERARIARKAVELGVFESSKQALLSLYRSASRAKRSKIRSFLTVVEALENDLEHPQAIGERMGLQLARRLETEPGFGDDLRGRLRASAPATAEAEQALLSAALSERAKPAGTETETGAKPGQFTERELRPGLSVRVHRDGRMELSGAALTADLRGRLLTWLQRQK